MSDPTIPGSAEETASIAACYGLIARLLANEIDSDTLAILQHESVLSNLAMGDPDRAQYLSRPWGSEEFEQAHADFCHLFILPETAIFPRPAAWLKKGTDTQPEGIHAVAAAFTDTGEIALSDACQSLPADHLSVLLSIAAALRLAGSEQVEEFEQLTLHPWAGTFARSLQQCSSPLYRSVGILLGSVMPEE